MGLLLVVSVIVGMYVRFWPVSARKTIVYDFEEEEVAITPELAAETYRDPILTHDMVARLEDSASEREDRPPSSFEARVDENDMLMREVVSMDELMKDDFA